MNYVVFDLEATCEDRNIDPNFQNEIIEIGAVKLNHNGEIIDTFSKFAKPHHDTILTEFCVNLTTITQEEIDNAESLDDVLKEFYEWSKDSKLLSWGGYDIRQLRRDIETQKSNINWQDMKDRHINFKGWYAKHNKLKKQCGMSKALRRENIILEGTHHRGIDDAKNISKIFSKYLSFFQK